MASLLELLVARQMISSDQAREASALAEETGAFIGRILVSQGAVEEQQLARFLAQECTEKPAPGMVEADAQLLQLLPERLMLNYHMVPLGRSPSGVLRLAVSEPLSIGGIDQVKRRLGMPVRLVLVSPQTIEAMLGATEAPGQAPPPPASMPLSGSADQSSLHPSQAPSPSLPQESLPEAERRGIVFRPRKVGRRVAAPEDWRPDPLPGEIPPALEDACESLHKLVEDSRHVFVVLVGPDAARNLMLRRLSTVMWEGRDVLYIDLIAHHFPDDVDHQRKTATILDGVDADSVDEEQEKRILRLISAAYAAKTPLVLGIRRSLKESQNLSRGMRLTLGLARTLTIDAEEVAEGAAHPYDPGQLFHALVEETAEWSEAAFAGASLRPLLVAASRAYALGTREQALAKATTAVASRVAHLTKGPDA